MQRRVGPVLVLRGRFLLCDGVGGRLAGAVGFAAARQVVVDGARLGLAEELGALVVRALVGRPLDAVAVDVEPPFLDQVPAAGPERREVVAGEREVLEVAEGEPAERVGHLAVQEVVRQVELLHLAQARERRRDGAGEAVGAGVDDRGLLEQAELVGEAAAEAVVEEEHLEERASVAGDGLGYLPREPVVGEREVVHGRLPDVVREAAGELVVVDEDGLHPREPAEDARRELPVEAVEPDVDEGGVGEAQHVRRERCRRELVVAQVQLVEVLQAAERRHGAAEVVGVGVEQRQVREVVDEALQGVRPQHVAVEVDGRDGPVRHVGRPLAEEALVAAAQVRAAPAPGDVHRVARHRAPELLDHQVRPVQPLVLEVARPRLRRRRRRRAAAAAANADADADAPASAPAAEADIEVLPVPARPAAGSATALHKRSARNQETEESNSASRGACWTWTCHFPDSDHGKRRWQKTRETKPRAACLAPCAFHASRESQPVPRGVSGQISPRIG
ncbi:hypothetical protein SORBI_3006G139501 [Sorghum bicolor]|uniref:Uncharacterized protein n=1 Tax=Sorghum bicolor TaxID=4558 RepID=A0A1Z5RDS7_SORBI|nr:hypothetical protein SORBI_3006G139501 [Sorghum bicolor]